MCLVPMVRGHPTDARGQTARANQLLRKVLRSRDRLARGVQRAASPSKRGSGALTEHLDCSLCGASSAPRAALTKPDSSTLVGRRLPASSDATSRKGSRPGWTLPGSPRLQPPGPSARDRPPFPNKRRSRIRSLVKSGAGIIREVFGTGTRLEVFTTSMSSLPGVTRQSIP